MKLPEPQEKLTRGLTAYRHGAVSYEYVLKEIEAYAELVREECARKVESFSDPEDDGWESAIREFASAIRNKE